MQMRMEKQALSPTVKYSEKADLSAQMLGIGSDGGQGLGRCKLIVAADKDRRSRNERYFTTTERLNVNLGSEQYQAKNLSMAYS